MTPPDTTPRPSPLRWLPAALWACVIFAGSSLNGSLIPSQLSVYGHVSEYLVLGALVMFAERHRGLGRAAIIAVLVCAAYGASDEFHQAFVPLRTPDPIDWITDVAGASAGIALYAVTSRVRGLLRTKRGPGTPPQ